MDCCVPTVRSHQQRHSCVRPALPLSRRWTRYRRTDGDFDRHLNLYSLFLAHRRPSTVETGSGSLPCRRNVAVNVQFSTTTRCHQTSDRFDWLTWDSEILLSCEQFWCHKFILHSKNLCKRRFQPTVAEPFSKVPTGRINRHQQH